MKKWRIILKALAIVIVLPGMRTQINIAGYDTVPINPVVSSYTPGAIVTIEVIFPGNFTDFKESEKIAGEMVSALTAHYNDAVVIPPRKRHPWCQKESHPDTLKHHQCTLYGEKLQLACNQPRDGQSPPMTSGYLAN